MPGCKVGKPVNNVCGDLLFPAGVNEDFWIGYVSDLSVKIPITQLTDVTSLSFFAYSGLIKMGGQKFSHKFDTEWVKGAGNTGYFKHSGIVKLIALSTQDDVSIQQLLQATDAFIINKNNNGTFFIYGAQNGMLSTPGALNTTGQVATDDVSDTVTLEGAEKTKALRFDVGGEAATLAYLNARTL